MEEPCEQRTADVNEDLERPFTMYTYEQTHWVPICITKPRF